MVVVYTTSSCGWCRLAKQYLDQKGVSYEEVDIAQNPARMAELVFKSSQTGVPVIDVNGTIVVGYNPSALERALQQISQ